MKVSDADLMKLFDFILENKNIIISDGGLFSRDTLIMIRAIVKGKLPNDFELTPEQKNLIALAFIKSEKSFNDDTPTFLFHEKDCIRAAILRDINSANYVENVPKDLETEIIEQAKAHNFILQWKSPKILKSNYEIAVNSIKQDSSSADFVNWYAFSEEETNNLINEALQNGYILTDGSCEFLSENYTVVLESIKKDQKTIEFANETMQDHPKIFKYLILHGYTYSTSYIERRTIDYFLDEDVMNYLFKIKSVFNGSNKKYIARFTKLYNIALNTFPTISTFESVFQMVAEESWKEHKQENIDWYENIFGKICAQLRNNSNFNDALENLSFDLRFKLEESLGEKYYQLYLAMKEYFNLFHSNIPNKLEKMLPSQEIIAKMSALYVAKAKEGYKKNELKNYYKWLKPYFTLRIDHPIVYKKLIQSKKKEQFKKLYQNNDKEIWAFLGNIIDKYSEVLDSNVIKIMIEFFITHKCSKIESIIKSPNKYDNYQRYEKAIRLIHRLNSGYIEYNGPELTNYRDIIAYDSNIGMYIYTGISFDDYDLKAFTEYRKKERIFEIIKKDIVQKIKTIEIDDKIDPALEKKLAAELPFTDEYFKFDKQYTFPCFTFKSFLNQCLDDDKGFEEDSLLDDESYKNIINIVSNNGLFWLLLFMSRNSNNRLDNFGINKETFIEFIDNMKKITDLSKELHFNLSKFQELFFANEITKYADAKSIAILGTEVIEKLYKHQDYTNEDAYDIISMASELLCQMTKRCKSTVPYINGQTENYRYSLYDSQDETLLLAGIYTDACFRVAGNDNDFLHYCALDKNGFVIKITDIFGNFIGRASGFRNGNCVFINQLRTIYDKGGEGYKGTYDSEKKDIIETFKKACEDIVEISHNNPEETTKIDFVFVTKSYSMKDTESNVSDEVTVAIGSKPMENKSEDWQYFVRNTNNLDEAEENDYFETDYGDYPIICMASSKKGKLKPRDLKPKNVPAVYERTRNKIIVTTSKDSVIINKLNKINGIKSHLNNEFYSSVLIPANATIFTGDNWYIVFDGLEITSSCVLDFDSKAKIEFEIVKKKLEEYTLSNVHSVNIEEVVQNLNFESPEESSEILQL